MGYRMADGKVIRTSFPKKLTEKQIKQIKQIDQSEVRTDVIERARAIVKRTKLQRTVATAI